MPSMAGSDSDLKRTTPCDLRTSMAVRKGAGKDTRPLPSMRLVCVFRNRAVFTNCDIALAPKPRSAGYASKSPADQTCDRGMPPQGGIEWDITGNEGLAMET